MNARFSVLGVMCSNLDQSQGMNPENDVSAKKWNSEKIPWYIRNFWRSVKTFFVPHLSLQCIKLPDDALVDPLGVRGSNLVQTKGMNAGNGLRPKKLLSGIPIWKITQRDTKTTRQLLFPRIRKRLYGAPKVANISKNFLRIPLFCAHIIFGVHTLRLVKVWAHNS